MGNKRDNPIAFYIMTDVVCQYYFQRSQLDKNSHFEVCFWFWVLRNTAVGLVNVLFENSTCIYRCKTIINVQLCLYKL